MGRSVRQAEVIGYWVLTVSAIVVRMGRARNPDDKRNRPWARNGMRKRGRKRLGYDREPTIE